MSPKDHSYFNTYRHFLSQVATVDDKEWDSMLPLLSVRSYQKGEFILRPDEVCDQMQFMVEGFARSYFIDESGREFNWSFHFNDSKAKPTNVFIVDYASFVSSSKSRLHMECLSEVTTVSIRREDLNSLYTQSHFWSEIGRQMSEQVYFITHNRNLNQFTLDAKDRYDQFVQTYAYLIDRLTQEQIASFLGITPQSLSRLKKTALI